MRIAKYPWHIGHDYELYKIPATFAVLADTHRTWPLSLRPIPPNVQFAPSIGAAEADVMILHVDQWTWDELDKRRLFEHYRDNFRGRIVVINHGCNIVDGCSSQTMQSLLGDLPMICNSPTARELWGVENSTYLRHGMTPSEWPQTNYGHNNVVVTQPAPGLHNECRNNQAILDLERDRGVKVDWIGRDRKFDAFHKYRSFLASSSIYFNPSYASANPRARTEAMLCGLAVVTTKSHDEGTYIENGRNGFASNDMDELYDYLEELLHNPRLAREIGRNGRQTAQKVFDSQLFVRRWITVLNRISVGHGIGDLALQGDTGQALDEELVPTN